MASEVLANWVGGPAERLLGLRFRYVRLRFLCSIGSMCLCLLLLLLLCALLQVVPKLVNKAMALEVANLMLCLLFVIVLTCMAAAVTWVLVTREVIACP